MQLDVVGAPVGVDDEIGGDVGARGFHEDMDALGAARAAGGVADDPARGVARRDRAGAGQAFAGFERDIRDLPGGGVDLVERAFAPRKNLHGVVIALLAGLDAGGGIGGDDARLRRIRFGIAAAGGRPGWRRVNRAGRPLGRGRCRRRSKGRDLVVIGDLGRALSGAGGQRGGREEKNGDGGNRVIGHSPSTS